MATTMHHLADGALGGHRRQTVPEPAVHVADDPAGQRGVEELRAVVRTDGGPQRHLDPEPAGDPLPAPRAAQRRHGGDRERRGQRHRADRAHGVDERLRPDPPHDHGEDRCAADNAQPPHRDASSASATSATVRSHPVRVVRRARAAARCSARCSRVGEPPAQRAGERVRVARRHQHPGAAERLAHPADVARDDRHPAGQRLGHDHPVGLRPRGEHEQVGVGVRRVQLGPGHRSGQPDGVAQTGRELRLDRGRPHTPAGPGEVVRGHAARRPARRTP